MKKGGETGPLHVQLRDGESPEHLMSRFNKGVMREGILKEVRSRRYFVSKSEQQRLARIKAERKRLRKMAARRPARRD